MYDRNKTSISIPNNNFYSLLESRLDSVLFRIYFAPSIFSSRQLINHGHILVNNIKITNPSFILKPMDIIMIKPNSFKKVNKLLLLKDTKKNKIKKFLLEKYKLLCIPKYTMVNYRILCAVFIRKPKMSEIPYPFRIKKNSIKNFYRTKFFYRNKLLFFK